MAHQNLCIRTARGRLLPWYCKTRPSNKRWIFRFLDIVESGIHMSQQHWGNQWFLLPSWTDSIPFTSPCSCNHGLALIRYYAQCNWLQPPLLSPDQARELSTHSMKSTLLAAAGQLNLNVEQRAKQGNHKHSRDGDLLPPRPEVLNNPCQNRILRRLLLLKLTYSSYRCWHQP